MTCWQFHTSLFIAQRCHRELSTRRNTEQAIKLVLLIFTKFADLFLKFVLRSGISHSYYSDHDLIKKYKISLLGFRCFLLHGAFKLKWVFLFCLINWLDDRTNHKSSLINKNVNDDDDVESHHDYSNLWATEFLSPGRAMNWLECWMCAKEKKGQSEERLIWCVKSLQDSHQHRDVHNMWLITYTFLNDFYCLAIFQWQNFINFSHFYLQTHLTRKRVDADQLRAHRCLRRNLSHQPRDSQYFSRNGKLKSFLAYLIHFSV